MARAPILNRAISFETGADDVIAGILLNVEVAGLVSGTPGCIQVEPLSPAGSALVKPVVCSDIVAEPGATPLVC